MLNLFVLKVKQVAKFLLADFEDLLVMSLSCILSVDCEEFLAVVVAHEEICRPISGQGRQLAVVCIRFLHSVLMWREIESSLFCREDLHCLEHGPVCVGPWP